MREYSKALKSKGWKLLFAGVFQGIPNVLNAIYGTRIRAKKCVVAMDLFARGREKINRKNLSLSTISQTISDSNKLKLFPRSREPNLIVSKLNFHPQIQSIKTFFSFPPLEKLKIVF